MNEPDLWTQISPLVAAIVASFLTSILTSIGYYTLEKRRFQVQDGIVPLKAKLDEVIFRLDELVEARDFRLGLDGIDLTEYFSARAAIGNASTDALTPESVFHMLLERLRRTFRNAGQLHPSDEDLSLVRDITEELTALRRVLSLKAEAKLALLWGRVRERRIEPELRRIVSALNRLSGPDATTFKTTEDSDMLEEPIVFTRKSSGLVKGLTWWDVFILVIAAPAGSGILYYSVSTASTYPGGNVAVAFLIGMALVFPVIFIAAATAGMIPRSGSLYVLISRVVSPGIGFVAAGLFFVGYTLSIGVVAYIVTQVVGGILVNGAMAGGLENLQRFGELLQAPRNAAIGGVVLVVGTWLLVLGGIRVFRRTMRWLFWITAVAVLVTVVYFFLVPTLGGAQPLFDEVWGAGTYEGVLNLAAQQGWQRPPFSWEATLGLLLVVLFSYAGLELISYASGEVAHVARKPFVGYLSGWTALASIYVIIAVSVLVAFGGFIGAYDFVFQNHPEALGEVMPAVSPSVPFYIASVIPNPVLGILLGTGLTLWLVTTMVPYFFAPSRLIFALAMDRAIPPSLADVSERTGAPTKASHLTLVFALAGVFLNWAGATVVLGTILFCALFVYWLYGLSALLLPFRRPDIYQASPVKCEVAGLPVLSWVGLLGFGVGWFVVFVAIGQLSNQVAIALAVLLVAVLLVYGLRLKANQRAGVDVDQIYYRLPPA